MAPALSLGPMTPRTASLGVPPSDTLAALLRTAPATNVGRMKDQVIDAMEAGEPDLYDDDFGDMPEDEAPKELKDAEERVPHSAFVQSCRAFFEKRGFLSDKQKRALTFAGTPNRRRRQFGPWFGYDSNGDDFS